VSEPLVLLVDCGDQYLIRVEFKFVEGRFRQRLDLYRSEQIVERWNDKTDSVDEDWPDAPPIQQLSLESINGCPALLGVGQAGKSHWSISVEPALSQSEPALRFDVACRTAIKPVWLGSTYQTTSLRNETHGPSLCLKLDAAFPGSMIRDTRVSCPLDVKVEAKNGRNSRSQTFRWGYRVCLG